MNLKIKTRDYTPAFLKNNPFPYVPIPPDSSLLLSGKEGVLERVENVLSSIVVNRKSNHAIIIGPYGSGKSHTLKFVHEQIRKHYSRDKNKFLVSYIFTPGTGIKDIFVQFIESIGFEEMKRIASLITKVLSHLDDKKLHREIAEQVASLCHRFPTPGIDA